MWDNCINAVHQLFVHGNPPFISVPLNYKCMFNCSSASAVVVHCGVSPILCVRGHREMVTRRLYLDQSFIPPQWLFVSYFIVSPLPIFQNLLPSARSPSLAPSGFSPGVSLPTAETPLVIGFAK